MDGYTFKEFLKDVKDFCGMSCFIGNYGYLCAR